MGNYYIGLDMGTSTLGWAVTDETYRLMRKKGKDMWGVRLFNEASTAVDRRTHRTARRRLQREKVRLGYIKEYFADAITAVDAGFYARLDDSKYDEADKSVMQPNALFADRDFKDADYYNQYPTVFHLRKELLLSLEPHDVRLVYLAVLNIFKHRGHFLNATLDDGGIGNLTGLYEDLCEIADDLLEMHLQNEENCKWLEDMLASKAYSNSGKLAAILDYVKISKSSDKPQVELWKLVCGLTGTLAVLFEKNETFDEENKKFSLSFRDGNYEEKISVAEGLLSEESFELLMLLKQIHDWGILANIMKGDNQTYQYLSMARVDAYEKHHKDLEILKSLYKQCGKEKYNAMFRVMEADNYSAYVGSVNSDKEVIRRGAKYVRENFYKRIKKDIAGLADSSEKTYILNEIDKESLLPKQIINSNGVIPNQVHKAELKQILANAENYLPFLKDKDESGLTVSERLVQLFAFQIPYYIGPLSPIVGGTFTGSQNLWSVRKEAGAIMPWNITQKIDEAASAENFIYKMVNHCTYLNGERVLPKNSLLYEKFMLLNELNNLRVNGERISPDLKQLMYNILFIKGKKVTQKAIIKFLKIHNIVGANDEVEISGIDQDVTNRLVNYARFADVFKTDKLTYDQEKIAEQIIEWATLYGDTKKFLIQKIKDTYGEQLSAEQIKRITGFKFKDWGRLSRELLQTEGADAETGEIKTIISRMWDENFNLMELIESRAFTYKDTIEEKREKLDKTLAEVTYEDLDTLYLSAPVKRMVWQTLLVLKEVTQIMGDQPAKVFVEMARDAKTEKVRTVSRKRKFAELYKKCKVDGINWSDRIANTDESEFRRKKLYLYYTQQGRCMYSGKQIDLSDLFNDNLYDIDHIYPRHFVKDDNIDNNLVLVEKNFNAHKSDSFPLESSIRSQRHAAWKALLDGGFINEEKYKRLTRGTEFTDDERVGFISRQIVETRQGTKAVTDLLTQSFPDSQIVYVKAGNVSDFRHKFDLVKCRSVNDFHHANDAYLNVVVGNVFDTKFTQNPYNFIKTYRKDPQKNNYHMDKIFDFDVVRNDKAAWLVKHGDSISTVRKMMQKNTPIVTKMNFEVHGGFYDQNIISKEQVAKAGGVGYIPIKVTDSKMTDVCKYGGYNKMTGAYFFLVEYEVKGKKVRSLEPMPLYRKDELNTLEKLEAYCKDELGYQNPSVRMQKIKMYSLIRVNGFNLYLTGRSNKMLFVCNSVQLALNNEDMKYCKILEKADSVMELSELEKIGVTSTKNIKLYNLLLHKHLNMIYSKRPNSVGTKLDEGKEVFISLGIERQVFVLKQILQLSQLVNRGANLLDIGSVKTAGVAMVNKKISDCEEFKLINQSVTGLYTSEIDLLTV